MLAQLIPADGGKPITIVKDVTLVGRKRDLCDLIVEGENVSKLQCILVKTDGLVFVRDLASTNGTKVNGQRVMRGALLPGDELAFANVKFKVHLGPSEEGDDEAEADSFRDETEMMNLGNAKADNSESDVRLYSDDSVV